jgi:hypothetical protein
MALINCALTDVNGNVLHMVLTAHRYLFHPLFLGRILPYRMCTQYLARDVSTKKWTNIAKAQVSCQIKDKMTSWMALQNSRPIIALM